ncbi:hypothetical protein GCM10020000_84990 [Streptomyces olivoverticillatus]
MCGHVLGIEPAAEEEKPKPRRTQGDKWAVNYAAAQQFHEREGHLQVPRKHIEQVVTGGRPRGARRNETSSWDRGSATSARGPRACHPNASSS